MDAYYVTVINKGQVITFSIMADNIESAVKLANEEIRYIVKDNDAELFIHYPYFPAAMAVGRTEDGNVRFSVIG